MSKLDKYKEVTSAFRSNTRFHGSVLAGGAVRDTLLGRPVKDLDFFTEALLTGHEPWLHSLFGKRFRKISNEAYEADKDATLLYVLESVDKAVNIMVCSDVYDRIYEFPDTLSQVWYDGSSIDATDAYMRDEEAKVCTYVERCGEKRLAKLREKFPDFTFIRKEGHYAD